LYARELSNLNLVAARKSSVDGNFGYFSAGQADWGCYQSSRTTERQAVICAGTELVSTGREALRIAASFVIGKS
jgi:hypothetical protein